MTAKRDCYEILGVSRDADDAAIKKAYRRLAKKYHPDSNAGNAEAEQRFKEITEAYGILSDQEKRKLYDQFGYAAFDGSAPGGAYGSWGSAGGAGNGGWNGAGYGGWRGTDDSYSANGRAGGSYNSCDGPGGGYREYHFEGGNMDDILKHVFGAGFRSGATGFSGNGGASGFGGFGGTSGFRGDGDPFDFSAYGAGADDRGQDLHAEISVSFDEAAFGCDKRITLSDPAADFTSGTGFGTGAGTGPNAGSRSRTGAGRHQRTLQVHIPAGIDTGKSIRLRGKGMPGIGGAPDGDLLLRVTVGTKAGFERKGQDVYTTATIPFTTAVFGGEAVVPTLYGKVACRINAGTQSGTKLRLKGKGIVSMKNPSVHGDQYVTIQIEVPTQLGDEAKRKLREFQYACGRADSASGAA